MLWWVFRPLSKYSLFLFIFSILSTVFLISFCLICFFWVWMLLIACLIYWYFISVVHFHYAFGWQGAGEDQDCWGEDWEWYLTSIFCSKQASRWW
jgi:hypothetical protein